MEKVRFGRTGLMVSRLAFGGIPLQRLSPADASRLVRDVIDLGINFIDTAHGYTNSEEKIGEAIKGIPREELIIATKSPAMDKATLNEHLEFSFRRLGVDYVDIYQLHNINTRAKYDAMFAPGGSMEGLTEAIAAGKVRFPAFTSHSLDMAIEIMQTDRFDSVQLAFNYIENAAADVALPLARKLDMGFIAMKPLGGGLFTDAALAFRYLGQFAGIVPDPGIETIEEMRELIGIVAQNEPFSAQDEARVAQARAELGSSWCRRCDYCQPCPQGINISLALGAQSVFKRMPVQRALSFLEPAMSKAGNCRDCNACLQRCPYHLNIPALIKEGQKLYERFSQ